MLVIFQGIGNSIDKKPYIFVIFQEGGGGGSHPPVPPLDPHMEMMLYIQVNNFSVMLGCFPRLNLY